MTTFQSPLVIGIFENEVQARNAVDMLRNAQFAHDQIGVAMRDGGVVPQNYVGDLMNLGVPQEQASYYNEEYKAGHIVVSVRPDGREDEVKNILSNNGAYDYNRNPSSQQPPMSATQNHYSARTESEGRQPDQADQPNPQETDNYGQNDYRQP